MKDFASLIKKVGRWSKKNFGDQPLINPLLGVVEEIGEIAHAVLKARQGIRGSKEDHVAELKDAIADALIYAADYCHRKGEPYPEPDINELISPSKDITDDAVARRAISIKAEEGFLVLYTIEDIGDLASALGWDWLELAHDVFDNVVSKRDWRKETNVVQDS